MTERASQLLRALYTAARRRWPEIELSRQQLVERVQAHLGEPPDPEALAKLHGDDFFLASACALRHPEAIAIFERELLSPAGKAAAAIDRSRDFIDEVKQQLRERLLTGAEPKIGDYAGRGPLGAWVQLAATRTALNLRRQAKNRRTVELPESQPAGAEVEPEIRILRMRHGRDLKTAMRSAMENLDDDERELLRLHYIESRSLKQIADDRGVDRSRVSRWVSAAREKLLQAVRDELSQKLALRENSVDSLLGVLASQLDLSLTGILPGK